MQMRPPWFWIISPFLFQVSSQALSFSFTVTQDIPVRDLKPAIVKVYDYYETGE